MAKPKKLTLLSYELEPKDSQIALRLSENLLRAVKRKAKKLGLSYQKVIRFAIEELLNK